MRPLYTEMRFIFGVLLILLSIAAFSTQIFTGNSSGIIGVNPSAPKGVRALDLSKGDRINVYYK